MLIQTAIDVAAQKTNRPRDSIVSVVRVEQDEMARQINHMDRDRTCPARCPYTLLSRIESHWAVTFRRQGDHEDDGEKETYVVYADGECIPFPRPTSGWDSLAKPQSMRAPPLFFWLHETMRLRGFALWLMLVPISLFGSLPIFVGLYALCGDRAPVFFLFASLISGMVVCVVGAVLAILRQTPAPERRRSIVFATAIWALLLGFFAVLWGLVWHDLNR